MHQLTAQQEQEIRSEVEAALAKGPFAAATPGADPDYAAAIGAIGWERVFAWLIQYGPQVLDFIKQIIDTFQPQNP